VTKLVILYSLSTVGIFTAICLFLYPTYIKLIDQINGSHAVHITTAECHKKMIISLLLMSVAAIFSGYVIARNGLQRVREFEANMEKINAESIHERINISEWPKELKRVGTKFNTMLDRIQTSFVQLSQFSSDIAHELRTPINNLMGVTELALRKDTYIDEQRQIFEAHMVEYQHLAKLIENLLFLARSDHGQLMLHKETVNARQEIVNICDYYQALADDYKIELNCEGDANLSVDLTLFKRVISNLLSNAIRHTLSDGKVTVIIEACQLVTKIAIHDNGVGIASDYVARIFDRFYRVDSSRSLQSGGVGLGLAIVKSIVNLHQGTISVESKVNIGTSVYLEFPIIHT